MKLDFTEEELKSMVDSIKSMIENTPEYPPDFFDINHPNYNKELTNLWKQINSDSFLQVLWEESYIDAYSHKRTSVKYKINADVIKYAIQEYIQAYTKVTPYNNRNIVCFFSETRKGYSPILTTIELNGISVDKLIRIIKMKYFL